MRLFGSVSRNKDGDWVVECEPHVMIRLKRVFGKLSRAAGRTAILSDSGENALELAWFLARYPMDNAATEYLARREAEHVALGEKITTVLGGNYVPREFKLAVKPRAYQRVAADLALSTGRLLIGDDVGLGKTAQAICALADPANRPALVVTLTHLPRQWQAEFAKFLPGIATHALKSRTPYKIDPLPDVLITNYAKLDGWAVELAGRMRSVVFDEVQELRIPESAKYQAAALIAGNATLKIGLSATPVYNYGGEIHSICEVIAPGELGEWDEFSREWTDGGERRKASVKDPRALGTYLREHGIMLRRTRADVGRELPPLTVVPHTIEADLDEINKMTGSVVELAKTIIRQGAGGFDKMRAAEEFSWRLRQATGIAKAPFVADFVRMLVESGEQVVLYGWHLEVYKIWQEKLADLNPVFFTGEQSPNQKEAAKQSFLRGDSKVLVMSLRAGAGVDGLQSVCRTVVKGELDWSPGVHEQATGRVYRDGQPDPVFVYYLISDSGSDPVIADVLGVKRGQSDGIRDPHGALIEQSQTDPDRMKKLAAAFLKQRGVKVEKERTEPKDKPTKRGQIPLIQEGA